MPGGASNGCAMVMALVCVSNVTPFGPTYAASNALTTPATVLGDPRVGALEVGRRADVVITDSHLRIIEVLRAGMVFHP